MNDGDLKDRREHDPESARAVEVIGDAFVAAFRALGGVIKVSPGGKDVSVVLGIPPNPIPHLPPNQFEIQITVRDLRKQ